MYHRTKKKQHNIIYSRSELPNHITSDTLKNELIGLPFFVAQLILVFLRGLCYRITDFSGLHALFSLTIVVSKNDLTQSLYVIGILILSE